MSRLGLLPPADFEAQHKQVYEAFEHDIAQRPGHYVYSKDEEGCLLGPAGALIHHPEVFKHAHGLRKALTTQLTNAGLSHHVQEVASLVVSAHTKAEYQIFTHSKKSGFPQDFLDDIREGVCPAELDEEGKIAFEVATELGKPGAMPESTWQKAVDAFGIQGAASLVKCVGFYKFLATVSNGFDIQLPGTYMSGDGSMSLPSSARSSVCQFWN